MEAPEVPLDDTEDKVKERARESEERWMLGVALSTAIFAAIAAVASLLAGQHINEGLISQLKASDDWSYYQAKGIKAAVLEAKMDLLKAEAKPASNADAAKVEQYAKEQADISQEAKGYGEESERHIARHEKLAAAVTFFQIAIAVSAIAVLTKRRRFWYVGLGFGVVGVVFSVVAHLV